MKHLPGFILSCIVGLIAGTMFGLAIGLEGSIKTERDLAISRKANQNAEAALSKAFATIKDRDRQIAEIGSELNVYRTMQAWDRFEEGRAR